ncbi:transposable element Tc3 transposase [Trichonephila clavipes]|nr:transposable element Tc3 transposase [Trichonephila clavipes]
MLGSRTDLHTFDAGSVNGTRYCNEILLPYVRLFRGAMGLQFLFMDDSAPCHRTVAAEQLLESEDIERMDWPARSPDLNPIEHVWDFLGRRLAARTLPPVMIRELRLALQDEWAAMPQQLIDTLILSMGRRCETCLAVRGDHIPYERPDVSCWTPITGICPVDPVIFPRFLQVGGALESSYEAFRFTESYGVIFQCNVKYCVGKCEPAICGDYLSLAREESWGRKRRSISDNAGPLEDEMTLSKEILVLDFGDEGVSTSLKHTPHSANESFVVQPSVSIFRRMCFQDLPHGTWCDDSFALRHLRLYCGLLCRSSKRQRNN